MYVWLIQMKFYFILEDQKLGLTAKKVPIVWLIKTAINNVLEKLPKFADLN